MIEIKGLGKSYGPKKVLEKVNLSVPDASVFGLVGINGAGKTTLLRMMADVLRPDEGTVEYDGENHRGQRKKAQRALLFARRSLLRGGDDGGKARRALQELLFV